MKSGWEGIQSSKDPIVIAARRLAVMMRQTDKRKRELDAIEELLKAELGQMQLAAYGPETSSDGNGALRFSDGVVKGQASNDTPIPHRTTFYGLFGRNASFENEGPFAIPKVWLDRQDEIDMTKTVTFTSTNDTVTGNMVYDTNLEWHRWLGLGGSPGSVVVDKQLNVVGVVVEGNTKSLNNRFLFDKNSRTVSTHVDGIIEALVKIYDADRIANELLGK